MLSVKTTFLNPFFVGKFSQYFRLNPQSMLSIVLIEDILKKLFKLKTELLPLIVMGPTCLCSLFSVIISPPNMLLVNCKHFKWSRSE